MAMFSTTMFSAIGFNRTGGGVRRLAARLQGRSKSRPLAGSLTLLLLAFFLAVTVLPAGAQSVRPPSNAAGGSSPQGGTVPGEALGNQSDSDIWDAIRRGGQGSVSIPDDRAGVLIRAEDGARRRTLEEIVAAQSNGLDAAANPNVPLQSASWIRTRMTVLPKYGAWAMGGMIAALLLFLLLRGRIRIEHGASGETITRFNTMERAGHWLLAVSFILLALTGLNLLYGRAFILPVIGKESFATITDLGKWVHNHVAFAFIAGLVMIFFAWVRDNIPNRHDVVWLLKGGGIFMKGVHPPSRRFNAGQKIIFWLVILGGASISLSGLALMVPFEMSMFAKTFEILNVFGFNFPTELTALEEMKYATIWHSIVALFLIVVIIAHIYIGSIGMEGAFDAMGSGDVDLNWAREHHNLWVEEEFARADAERGQSGGRLQPAE